MILVCEPAQKWEWRALASQEEKRTSVQQMGTGDPQDTPKRKVWPVSVVHTHSTQNEVQLRGETKKRT